jgi:hypothetical protein
MGTNMTIPDKGAFQDARNALLLARQLARLNHERKTNKWLDGVLTEVELENGYHSPVPLVNQATFLAMCYATLVSLRESYFKDASATALLVKRVSTVFDDPTLRITTGPSSTPINRANAVQLIRRVRNSLGHGSFEISNTTFIFRDDNPRDADDWAEIEMQWATLGKLSESIIYAGNDLLYPA